MSLAYADPKPQSTKQESYRDSHRPHNSLYYESANDRDEPFDVRADFDGDGPRWSDRFGNGMKEIDGSVRGSYHPVEKHSAPFGHTAKSTINASREELVSVPVLGPDWQKTELHELSRRGQSDIRQEKRTRAWREWTRDQRGTFGVHWLTRRLLAFIMFFFCVGLAITLFFVIPRAPHFSFYDTAPFTVDNSTISFSRTPTNFSFTGNLQLVADTTPSYLPVHFSNIQATVYDLTTNKAIATGNYGNHVVKKGSSEPVSIPVEFSYSAVNATDTTWLDVYNACGHLWTGTVRPDMKLRLEVRMSIIGLVTHPISETQISGVTCPFELPANSV